VTKHSNKQHDVLTKQVNAGQQTVVDGHRIVYIKPRCSKLQAAATFELCRSPFLLNLLGPAGGLDLLRGPIQAWPHQIATEPGE